MRALLIVSAITLSGCGSELSPVYHVIDGDDVFMLACEHTACKYAARETCLDQGFDRYEILEWHAGDEIGEGRGATIRCKA
jgi:hypothetical protein